MLYNKLSLAINYTLIFGSPGHVPSSEETARPAARPGQPEALLYPHRRCLRPLGAPVHLLSQLAPSTGDGYSRGQPVPDPPGGARSGQRVHAESGARGDSVPVPACASAEPRRSRWHRPGADARSAAGCSLTQRGAVGALEASRCAVAGCRDAVWSGPSVERVSRAAGEGPGAVFVSA